MNKAIFFKVTGKGEFPLDMLRYDECYPATTMSAQSIAAIESVIDEDSGRYRRVKREVYLVSHRRFITEDRWSSFGWTVVWDQS